MNKGKAHGGADDWEYLPSAWPLFSAREHAAEFCEEQGFTGVQQTGFFKQLHAWSGNTNNKYFITRELERQLKAKEYWPPEGLLKRQSRSMMQKEALKGGSSEEPWTNADPSGHEFMSSRASVVGLFVGHSPASKDPGTTAMMTPSRKQFGTVNFSQDLLPFLCREDDVEEKNKTVRKRIWLRGQPASSPSTAQQQAEPNPPGSPEQEEEKEGAEPCEEDVPVWDAD